MSDTAIPTRRIGHVDLGTFIAGERPPALQVTFTDLDDVPIDLTGFDVRVVLTRVGQASDELVGALYDAAGGVARYQWSAGDLDTVGTYLATVWVGDGTLRYASSTYVLVVTAGAGAAPAI